MLTDNQENTFTLKPINCFNRQCAIELKVNGKKMTNAEMAGIDQIRISYDHFHSISMKGMIPQSQCLVPASELRSRVVRSSPLVRNLGLV